MWSLNVALFSSFFLIYFIVLKGSLATLRLHCTVQATVQALQGFIAWERMRLFKFLLSLHSLQTFTLSKWVDLRMGEPLKGGSSGSESDADGSKVDDTAGQKGGAGVSRIDGPVKANLGTPVYHVEGPVRVEGVVRVADAGSASKNEAAQRAVEHTELERGKLEGTYLMIKNILDIKEDPVYSAAFEEWNRQLTVHRTELEEWGKDKTDLTTQVYNIVGFFSVFQGVVLTSVSQLSSANQSKCGKVWVPVLLSVIAALVAIVPLCAKFVSINKLERNLTTSKRDRNVSSSLFFRIRFCAVPYH